METLFQKFEGSEKKLEIILVSPLPGLRDNFDGRWEKVVKSSNAEILSKISSEKLDAYLLSESSLFVWEDRILMITCGRTSLVQALPAILNIINHKQAAFVFYEQKNFMFPYEQPSSFEKDIVTIQSFFPGKAYILGPVNDNHINVFCSSHEMAGSSSLNYVNFSEDDATIQILMSELDPSVTDIFCGSFIRKKELAFTKSGLDRVYEKKMLVDHHLFDPCGYSLNAVAGSEYYTTHVTPQAQGSYASFESNIIEPDYARLISKVLSVFKPGRFSVSLTSTMNDHCLSLHPALSGDISQYKIMEKGMYEFDNGYCVTFVNRQKNRGD